MEEQSPPATCPWLGSQRDSQVRWTFSSSLHFCWSPQHPRTDPEDSCVELPMDIQRKHCLREQHGNCPFYTPPPDRAQPADAASPPTRAVCFFLGGKTGRFDFRSQPSEENACFSLTAPHSWWQRFRKTDYVEVASEHQGTFCLQETFRNCPFFNEDQSSL